MVDFCFFYVVYIYWDMQYCGESNKICFYMVDGEYVVVSVLVCYY